MKATRAPLYGPDVIVEHAAKSRRLSGAANVLDARVGYLLAQWLVSSPHCNVWLEQATVEGGNKMVCAPRRPPYKKTRS